MSGRGFAIWSLSVGVLVLSGASCGDGGGTCGRVPSCGGDIVGDWRVTSSCVRASSAITLNGCAQQSTVSTSFTLSGTASLTALVRRC
jgi:hypothetical protein